MCCDKNYNNNLQIRKHCLYIDDFLLISLNQETKTQCVRIATKGKSLLFYFVFVFSSILYSFPK